MHLKVYCQICGVGTKDYRTTKSGKVVCRKQCKPKQGLRQRLKDRKKKVKI